MSRWFVIVPLMVALVAAPVNARAAPGDGIVVPITATFGTATLTGSFTIASFQVVNEQLLAVGTLTGTLTNNGNVVGTLSALPFTINVSIAEATCGTLTLTLGPIDVNLLGLQFHLGAFTFEIAPQPDSSPTLLNFLCAIARQIVSSGQASLQSVVGLLNRVVAAY